MFAVIGDLRAKIACDTDFMQEWVLSLWGLETPKLVYMENSENQDEMLRNPAAFHQGLSALFAKSKPIFSNSFWKL